MNTKTITITRIFDAPRERVWEAWTNPDDVQKWWGPEGFSAPTATVDFRVGGTYVYAMQGPAGTEWDKIMYSGGEYLEIVPMERVVATDYFTDEKGNWIDPSTLGMPGEWPEKMKVTAVFEDAGEGKTKLTLTHEGHPAEMATDAETGWSQSLDKFAKIL